MKLLGCACGFWIDLFAALLETDISVIYLYQIVCMKRVADFYDGLAPVQAAYALDRSQPFP